ncbi:MAG: 50S ribosomal protein L19 [Candidatus Eisenbacteria bacterium]|nr:50S ribosomal protein L19 [Candidatus Eisenbacteria bacterium]
MHERIREIEKRYTRDKTPEFGVGDTVRVDVRITEGSKERTQAFEGTVIARQGTGPNETFIVRRVTQGIGVERIFPVSSPNVQAVHVTRHGKTRRAKLYYLRKRTGKAAKTKARDIR